MKNILKNNKKIGSGRKMVEDKRVLIEPEMHKKLKIKATTKGKNIKAYLNEILKQELESDISDKNDE